jgi:integrase/recombinase XerD
MVNPTQVPVSGLIAEFGPGFASALLRQGYKTKPAGVQMNLMAHLSRWLADEGLDVHQLSDTEVERYLRARRSHSEP